MFYLGDEATNMDRIEALKDECLRKKEEKPQGSIGFGNYLLSRALAQRAAARVFMGVRRAHSGK